MSGTEQFPRGTVTFLFTDIEGSTALWERAPETMRSAVDRHVVILVEAIAAHRGVHFKTVGDALQAAFHTAPDALAAAIAGQRAILAEPWPAEIGSLRVRMAIHAGAAEPAAGDYLAAPLNRLARMLGIGHGGQLLVSEAARALLVSALPPDVTLRPLGAHLLRGLDDPEPIFQVVAPRLPDQFPPLRALAHHPTNLVAPPAELVGRDRELRDVMRLLREEGTRLVTLTGPGGSGKTRLAIEVAAELLSEFPDGAFFVDLSSLRDPGLVMATVASTLGLREVSGQPLFETIAMFLSPKRLLLVLDNCEHVIDAAAALASLLARCPALAVLVTSREPLRIRAEREYPVEPFVLPPVGQPLSLDEVTRLPAVALFVARARASSPAFALTEANAAAVLEICRRLDGLPLAIELAAARTRLLPPMALLQRLERRLPVLTGGARDLPDRQRTLRDTIAWSHNLLDETERTLFRRLGVFAGGWSFDAAEAVIAPGGELDLLGGMQSLIEQSLVRVDERENESRYRMLETIREFAVEQLAASGEEDRLRQALAAYVLAIAEERAGPAISAEEIDEAWIARMERDHDNLRSVLTWLIDRRDAEGAVRLGAAAGAFWAWSDHWAEGRAVLERILAIAPSADPDRRAPVVYYAGSFAFAQGDTRAAVALLEPGLTLQVSAAARPWIFRMLLKLAQAYGHLRDFDHAMTHYQRALELATGLEAQQAALEVRWSMAYTATSRGDLRRANEIAESVLRDEGESGNRVVVAGTRELLVWIALAAGDLDLAERRLAEARDAVVGAPPWAEGIRVNLMIDEAVLAYRRDDDARAAALVREWLPRARAIDSRQDLVFALLMLASIAAHREMPAEAARWFGALYAALAGGEHAMHLEPAIRPWHEADLARVRASLGQDAFDRAWIAGQRLSLDEALMEAERALAPASAADPDPPPPSPPAGTATGG